MKEKIIRICAWFTMILFSLCSIVGLVLIFSENFDPAAFGTFFMCSGLSITGWHGRKIGLPTFTLNRYSRPLAIFSLIVGATWILIVPWIFVSFFGIEDTYGAIINLEITFIPVLIASIGVIFSKHMNINLEDNFESK